MRDHLYLNKYYYLNKAFTTGAAYHIVTSQIPLMLGLKIKIPEIPTKIIGVF